MTLPPPPLTKQTNNTCSAITLFSPVSLYSVSDHGSFDLSVSAVDASVTIHVGKTSRTIFTFLTVAIGLIVQTELQNLKKKKSLLRC